MASINYAAREISVKIVYYGPGLSGKTTNLQVIHRKIPTEYRSDMVSLATETDRTLFFDFLPLDLGKIKGFTTKFQLYTVPGQVYYNATRKLVLRGVDGVVFVVDSAADKVEENLESFRNLEENLAEYGYQRESIPIILQYNKRDLPNALSIDELNKQVNKYNLAYNEAVAAKGIGVFESLKLIGKIVLDFLNKKYNRQPSTPAAARPQPTAQPVPPPRVQQAPLAPVPVIATDPFAGYASPVQAPPPLAPPRLSPAPAVLEDPFLQSGLSKAPAIPAYSPSPAPVSPGSTGDYSDYGSIKLESMEQPGIAQSEIPAPPQKSAADFEIETYQREIEKGHQTSPESTVEHSFELGSRPAMQQSGFQPPPPQNWQQQPTQGQPQWYAPPPLTAPMPPQQQQWQQPPQQQQSYQWNQQQPPQNWPQQQPAQNAVPAPQAWAQQQPGFGNPAAAPAIDYNVYNVQPPQPNIVPHAPQTSNSFPSAHQGSSEGADGTGGDDALFFTSVDTDRARKPKKPVNPKSKQGKGIFGKLFSRNNP